MKKNGRKYRKLQREKENKSEDLKSECQLVQIEYKDNITISHLALSQIITFTLPREEILQ